MLLYELSGFDWGFIPALLSLVLLCGFYVFVVKRASGANERGSTRGNFFHEDFLLMCLGVVCFLLVSRLAWIHYFVLLIPMILHIARTAFVRPFISSGLLYRAYAIVTLFLLSRYAVIFLFGFPDTHGSAVLYACGTAMLGAAALLELRKQVMGTNCRLSSTQAESLSREFH
jgi:hypothetical protein